MTAGGRHLDLPRGFRDTDPERMALYHRLQQDWFDTCRLAGHQPVQVPPVGFTDTFTAGHHAAGQRLYRFPDRRGRDLSLISDSLPALLRMAHTRPFPEQRLSYCCPIFRYERRPRRHFHHLGLMEVLNRASSPAEQERSVTRLAEITTRFLTPRVPAAFIITDPGIWHSLVAPFMPAAKATEFLNQLRRLPRERRPQRLGKHQAPPALVRFAELLAGNPNPDTSDFAAPRIVHERVDACRRIADAVRHCGAEVIIDLSELHASEFHDGPSFLIRPRYERRLIGDGGSYGRFARAFLGTPRATYSAVLGLERLADLIGANEDTLPSADIAILAQPEPETRTHAENLAGDLRSAGIAVWDLTIAKPLRQHLRELSDLQIPCSILVGAQELNSNAYMVRRSNGDLRIVEASQLVTWLLSNRSAHPYS